MPSERQHRTDWEHLFFLAVLSAFLVWYLWTAAVASPTFSNLLLIAPVGAVAFGLVLYVGSAGLPGRGAITPASSIGQNGAAAKAAPSRFRSSLLMTILLSMGLFGLFAAAMPYLGFDLAIFFFVLATLWLLGERRVLFSLALALGVAVTLSVAALTLLTFPTPLEIVRIMWSAM